MKPPYDVSTEILNWIASISEKLGVVKANYLNKPSPQLRKNTKIKTIHSSLSIEGNTLTEEQITAILDNKRVVGPQKDINEVLNANNVYDNISKFNPISPKSFLEAHKLLMEGLVNSPGKYRTKDVGIIHGSRIAHLAPQPGNVPTLMNQLFSYLKKDKDISLIKSCVFHYELEFIHPFEDGNGRMGRLWQTVILMQDYPVFEYIPFETLINDSQDEYYAALKASDKEGKSTMFIEYMLSVIDNSLDDVITERSRKLSGVERIKYFLELTENKFSRKDYIKVFKTISTATASRDLQQGVELGIMRKTGTGNKTKYEKTTGHNI
ncbi:MAG: Fic family protein [Bacteroidota bacterium]|nr:Fic family protein [Bacteroidota bacterium]